MPRRGKSWPMQSGNFFASRQAAKTQAEPTDTTKSETGAGGAIATVVAAMLTVHRMLGTWERAVDAMITPSHFARNKLAEGGVFGQGAD